MNILLPGNSNATIEICENANYGYVVNKTCVGQSSKRLLTQVRKQKDFENSEKLRSPSVLELVSQDDKTIVTMEFVRGSDFVSFTNSASREDFRLAISILIDHILLEFHHAEEKDLPETIWLNKVDDVVNQCKDRKIFSSSDSETIVKFLKSDLPQKIPIGKCHGDLTFSNVIVERADRLCIFDFLDPPIETPYEDVAKFLQDAQFFWSINKHVGQFDRNRVKIYWSYAADMLRQSISEVCNFKILQKFQVLGLLRILPYTADESVIYFLSESILREVNSDPSSSMRWRIK